MSTQKKIVIVGAEATMTNLLTVLLESDGYQVSTIHNRDKGNKKLQTDMVDLIVFDMPPFETDVVSVVEELHGMFDAPLIILSAAASRRVTAQVLQAGAAAYMVKPFSAQKFLDEVAMHVRHNQYAPVAMASRSIT
ncbi:MAG: response regulator transcription factor [Caldilineaceae bacterium]|nr:response regulator transcription factor [Caldilineaceae bacterium]